MFSMVAAATPIMLHTRIDKIDNDIPVPASVLCQHRGKSTAKLLSLLLTGVLVSCGSGTLPTAPDTGTNGAATALPAIPAENTAGEPVAAAASNETGNLPASELTNPASGSTPSTAATSDNPDNLTSPDTVSPDPVGTTEEPPTMMAIVPTELLCDANPAALQQAIVALTNQSRRQAQTCGSTGFAATTDVVADATLVLAAQQHSDDMASNNFFSHTGSNGLSVADRIDNLGFNWFNVGENIAAGQESLAEAHDGWMQSPGHCENIMNPRYTRMGVACASSGQSNFDRYWTVVFARDAED